MSKAQTIRLTDADIRAAAEAILRAEQGAAVMPALSTRHPGLGLDDAYRIQDDLNAMRQRQGAAFAGYKIGLTWRTTQIACGLDGPVFGRILAGAVHASGARLAAGRHVAPHVEMELAFIMGRDVDAPLETPEAVLEATASLVPALELVDFHMAPPRSVADTVSDNSAFAGVVLSERRFAPRDLDTSWLGATLARNGLVEETGLSAIGMGDPAVCVAWLANTLLKRGRRLSRGDLVMSGAIARALPVAAGDTFEADFGPCGTLAVSFE